MPDQLEKAEITFLLGDNPDSIVRALFTTVDGDFEMKYLGFTISQYMERLAAWCEKAAQERRDLERLMESMEAGNLQQMAILRYIDSLILSVR